ncbi:acyltransferase family protein [Enterococcus florum]|uniref:acyltransferase family protein n=1 Tax=Enterococcus florum TaxID=2480627 RepID=UPI0011BA86E8|nr:acyltransferase family protein [Enterococcus florum]
MMGTKKNLNIELIRIIAMMMIVYHHFFAHSKWVFSNEGSVKEILIQLVGSFGKIGVILFILITGYFYTKQHFSLKKIILLGNYGRFYSFLSILIVVIFSNITIDKRNILEALFPIEFQLYWFLTAYAILYFFQPFIKEALMKFEPKQMLRYTSFFILAAYTSTILGGLFKFEVNYYVPNVILFFLIFVFSGHLIRIYQKDILGKYFMFVIFCFTISFCLILLRPFILMHFSSIDFPNFFLIGTESMNALIFGISLFLIVLKIPVQNNRICRYSSQMIDIYLIHDNRLMRQFIWIYLFKNRELIDNVFFYFMIIIEPLLVFLVCLLLSYSRIYVFKKIRFFHEKSVKYIQ